ncbi:glycosyltransferase, partial [Xanthomonas citri pv. citri]
MKLSVLVPVYDEATTVVAALHRILAVDYPCDIEVVVVDDGSTDATPSLLAGLHEPRLRVVTHAANAGKGAAIRT